jgi:hypothetical protein
LKRAFVENKSPQKLFDKFYWLSKYCCPIIKVRKPIPGKSKNAFLIKEFLLFSLQNGSLTVKKRSHERNKFMK